MKKFGKKVDRENNNVFFSDFLNNQENDLFSCSTFDQNSQNHNSLYQESLSKKLKVSVNNNDNNFKDDFFLMRTKSEMLSSSSKNYFIESKIKNNSENLKKYPIDQPTTSTRKLLRLSELEERNLYNILKVEENSNQEKIKRSYKLLCVTNHPDKGGEPENFRKILKAFKILNNDLTRTIYDKFSYRAMDLIDYILTHEDETKKISDLFKEESDLELLSLLIMCKK
jgi:hypothetical protein